MYHEQLIRLCLSNTNILIDSSCHHPCTAPIDESVFLRGEVPVVAPSSIPLPPMHCDNPARRSTFERMIIWPEPVPDVTGVTAHIFIQQAGAPVYAEPQTPCIQCGLNAETDNSDTTILPFLRVDSFMQPFPPAATDS